MRNWRVPLNIWRNRQGVAETDVAITKFYCNYNALKIAVTITYEITSSAI
jgi:hypothetical protein